MAILIYIFWLILAVVLQVLLFSHLSLFGGVVLLYMVALIKMPVETNKVLQIFVGFLVGFVIDIFCNTLGMNSLAAVTIMFGREKILHLYYNEPEFKNGTISFSSIGISPYLRYSATILGAYCILLYLIESFTLFNFPVLLVKILLSTLLSFAMSAVLEFATLKK